VRPFSADEGRDYLTKRRSLPADARVDAIVDRSTGVPFKLSLFATIVQDDPSLDEQAIREMPNVNVEFLIKRVVDQINEPMAQWVLRHGVVPRQLTRTFLRDVMLPRLQEIQRGSSTLDSGQDKLPDRLHNPDRFKRGLLAASTDTIDVDGLWRTLNRYAADYSWISQSKDWPDTLVFHADVVNAMRFLLQEHEIFQHLHEDAIRYYDARAASDEANWARWTREALYHRFQRGGPEAVAAWKRALEQATGRGSARREVAEEILGSEYVDDTGKPRQRKDGSAMVPVDVLVSATYEAARAGVEEAQLRQLSPTDRLWSIADRRIKEVVRIQGTLTTPVVSESAIAIVSARIELPRNPERARQLLEGVRKDVTPDIASEFEELYGDALRTKDVRSAGAHYRAALDLLPGDSFRQGQAIVLELKVAQSASSAGDYAQAIEAGEHALAAAKDTVFGTTTGNARVEVAASLLAAGRIDDAMRACGDGENIVSDVDRARLAGIGGRTRLLAGDPLSAWSYARGRFPRAFNTSVQTFRTFEDAEGLELKAAIHAAFFEYEEALGAWRDARHAWDVVRFPDRSFECVLRSVGVLIRETEQFALAGQMMSEAERTAASLGADAELRFRTLEAERRAVTDRASALAVLDSVLDAPNLSTAREPRVGVDAATLAIVMDHRASDAASLLSAILERITPPAARLGMLATLCRSRSLVDKLTTLRPVLHPAIDDALDESKPANAWTVAALSALCWMSETTDAGKRIERALGRLVSDSSLFRLLALREIAGRLDVNPSPTIFEQSLTTRFLEEFQEHPRVCGALLLSEAESRLRRDRRPPSPDTLTKLAEYLGDPAKLTSSLRSRFKFLTDSVPTPAGASLPVAPSASFEPAGLPVPKKAETATVTIAFGSRNDQAVITDSSEPAADRPIADWFSALTGGTAESFTTRGLPTPLALASRLARDPQVGHDIFQLLCDERVVEERSEPAGIRIQTSHSLYGAIPWELARTRDRLLIMHPKVRCLYRSAPADISFRPGVLTPSRPRSKSVVIVRRSYRSQLSEVRGSVFAGFDVEQLYRQAGWTVTVLEDPAASRIKSTLLTTHADLLHINAHVAEASRLGGLYLDIGREVEQFTKSSEFADGARRGEGIPVADLVETLHPRPDPAPLLVLDPPSIPGDTEAARQLLLRNAFAADAFQLGAIPTILATGLLRGDDYRRVASELVSGLNRGQSVHDVCTAMRKVKAADPGAIEYPVTTALFTQDPETRPFSADHTS
jgi:tetratricopeptide (TPR) repeat protein